jgi:hypothetical protein
VKAERSILSLPVKSRLSGNSLRVLVPVIAFVHFVLVFSIFTPNLGEITGFGEAAYINSGRLLVDGVLPSFGYSPLSAFFYALTYLPFQQSPYWLIYSCSIGRVLLFTLLWFGAYLVVDTFHKREATLLDSPLVMTTLLIASPALTFLITHGSHALFAAMSAFSLWQVLQFSHSKKTAHLFGASVFAGLSVLARSGEGAILFVGFASLIPCLSRGTKHLGSVIAAAILPALILCGGYIMIQSRLAGTFDLGIAEYSYFTFEQGHGLAYQSQDSNSENFYVAGQLDARRLFGTGQENGYSIKTAILRNPAAYLERIPRLIPWVPRYAIEMYGGGLGIIILLFAARGVIELLRKQLHRLLVILLMWSSYSAVYPLLVFQPTHFLLPFYIVFLLASVGVTASVRNLDGSREHYLWYMILIGLIAIGISRAYLSFFPALPIVLVSLAIIWSILAYQENDAVLQCIRLMVVLMALLISGHYPQPKLLSLNDDSELNATLFMREHLTPASFVGAYAPKNVWMAKQNYIPMSRNAFPDLLPDGEFSGWLRNNHVRAIYSDPMLKILEPAIWQLVQKHVGVELQVGFSSRDGKWQVLTARDVSDADPSTYIDRQWYSSKPRFTTEAHKKPSRDFFTDSTNGGINDYFH